MIPGYTRPEQYDQKVIRRLLAQHQLAEVVGKELVVYIGNTGAGKSTLINAMLGAKFRENKETFRYEVTAARYPTARMGSETGSSQTTQVGLYPDPKWGFVHCDTPGFEDSRGAEYQLWVKHTISTTLAYAKRLKALVVVMQYGGLTESKGKCVRDLAAQVALMLGDVAACADTLVFVVNRAGATTESHVRGHVKALVQSLHDTAKAQTSRWKTPTLEQQREVAALGQIIDFLNIMADGRRIIVCRDLLATPTSTTTDLLKFIQYPRALPPPPVLSSETLLVVGQVVAITASGLLQETRKKADTLRLFHQEIQKNKTDIKAIQKNWEDHKANLVSGQQTVIRELEAKKLRAIEECNVLQKSTVLEVYTSKDITKIKSSAFFSWTCFGGGWAEESYTYSDKPFVQYQVKTTKCSYDEKDSNPSQGTLQLSFTSESGCSLDANVQIQMYRKDLPSSQRLIKDLQEDVSSFDTKIKMAKQRELRFNTATSAEELMQALTDNLSKNTEVLHQIQRKWDMPDLEDGSQEGIQITTQHVVNGFHKFLKIHQQHGSSGHIIHPQLDQANTRYLDDFLKACEECVQLGEEVCVQDALGSLLTQAKSVAAPEESQPPVHHPLSVDSALQGWEVLVAIAGPLCSAFSLELAMCSIVLGIALGGRLGLVLLACGTFGVVRHLRVMGNRVVRALNTQVSLINARLDTLQGTANEVAHTSTTQFADALDLSKLNLQGAASADVKLSLL